MDPVSIYSALVREGLITELEESNEQLHAEILFLGSELNAAELTIQLVDQDRNEADHEANRLGDLIDAAVDSLRLLTEVPLRDLEDSIEEIVKGLTA